MALLGLGHYLIVDAELLGTSNHRLVPAGLIELGLAAVTHDGVVYDFGRACVPTRSDVPTGLGFLRNLSEHNKRRLEQPLFFLLPVVRVPTKKRTSELPVHRYNEIRQQVVQRFRTSHEPNAARTDAQL